MLCFLTSDSMYVLCDVARATLEDINCAVHPHFRCSSFSFNLTFKQSPPLIYFLSLIFERIPIYLQHVELRR